MFSVHTHTQTCTYLGRDFWYIIMLTLLSHSRYYVQWTRNRNDNNFTIAILLFRLLLHERPCPPSRTCSSYTGKQLNCTTLHSNAFNQINAISKSEWMTISAVAKRQREKKNHLLKIKCENNIYKRCLPYFRDTRIYSRVVLVQNVSYTLSLLCYLCPRTNPVHLIWLQLALKYPQTIIHSAPQSQPINKENGIEILRYKCVLCKSSGFLFVFLSTFGARRKFGVFMSVWVFLWVFSGTLTRFYFK